MAWIIRTLKSLAKWTAILFGGLTALIVGVFMLAGFAEKAEQKGREEAQAKQVARQAKQQEWEDGWKQWYEDAKAKNAETKKEPPAPGWEDGFKLGYMTGFTHARGGGKNLTSADVDALSRRQATESNVPEDERFAWKKGFSAGWTFGWGKGQ